MEIKDFYVKNIGAKINADIMKLRYLSNLDINTCDYVIGVMPEVECNVITLGNQISLFEMIVNTMNYIRVFGDETYYKAEDLLMYSPNIPIKDLPTDFATNITYMVDDVSGLVKCGEFKEFIIPKQIYECSAINYGHEVFHALKDSNYNEHKNSYTLGETIPLFYELISLNNGDIYSKDMIKMRLFLLYKHGIEYNFAKDLMEIEEEKTDLDKWSGRKFSHYMLSRVGCYINSFYYATILYSMYKVTPDKIMNLINKVLNHEITTLDMLITLGIYNDIKGEVFENELEIVRKLIK